MRKIILTTLAALFAASANQVHADTPPANAVPMSRTQVPGYFRIMVGQAEVTAIYDGWLSLPVKSYHSHTTIPIEELNALVERSFMTIMPDGGVNTAVSAYIINTGRNLVLLDAGAGDSYGHDLGKLADNIRAAGYTPSQIDVIIPTHMHFDHFSGVTVGGRMLFPNATIYLANEEKQYWIDTPIDRIEAHQQKFVQMARDAAAPYLAAGRVKYYDLGSEIIPGFKAIPTQGHTPGHGSIEFTSAGSKLLVWGDLMHNHAIQLPDPSVAADFDVKPEAARATRLRMFKEVAHSRTMIAGAHLPFPGIGHIRQESIGYSWIPVQYMPVFDNNKK